jgi:hypothetical protein
LSGCHDDYIAQTIPLENDISTKPISVDEAKTWYQEQQIGSANANPTDDSLLILPNARPNWDSAFNSLNTGNRDFVVAPLNLSGEDGRLKTKLLVTRNASGAPIGIFVMYFADDAYHTQTNGNYNPLDFNGTAIYTDITGHFLFGYKIDNGHLSNQVTAKLQSANSQDYRATSNGATLRACTFVQTVYVGVCPEGRVFRSGECFRVVVTKMVCENTIPALVQNEPVWTGGNSSNTGMGSPTVTWGASQPASLFSEAQINQMRTLFGTNGLSDLFDILNSTNRTELIIVNSFLARSSQVNIALFRKYSSEGFSYAEFNDLFSNQPRFNEVDPFLVQNNFDVDSKEYVRAILKNLKDAKELATPTSGFCNKKDLYNYVKDKNPNLTEGQLQDKIGTMFENAWNTWNVVSPVGGYEPNTGDAFKRFSPSRNAYVAPDGFMKSIKNLSGLQYGVDQKAHWVECKASNKDFISLGDYDGQIKGEIEVLSLWNPVACTNEMAAMSYVTTIDMIPSPKVTKYANDRGIWVLNSYPYFEIRADGKMYITFTSVFRYSVQFGEPVLPPTMAALKQTLSSNYVEFK